MWRQAPDTKATAAERAIRALVKRGEAITFQTVAREAGVSHAFLYQNPELRRRIEHLRNQARPTPATKPDTDRNDTVLLALTAQIEQLKTRHRQEIQALRAALEQAHGENLGLRRKLNRRGLPRQEPDSAPPKPDGFPRHHSR